MQRCQISEGKPILAPSVRIYVHAFPFSYSFGVVLRYLLHIFLYVHIPTPILEISIALVGKMRATLWHRYPIRATNSNCYNYLSPAFKPPSVKAFKLIADLTRCKSEAHNTTKKKHCLN